MAAIRVDSAPEDGRKGLPKHVEHTCRFNKHNTARVASCWFIIYYIIGIATRYVLKVSGFHPQWGCKIFLFSIPVETEPEVPFSFLYNGYRGSYQGEGGRGMPLNAHPHVKTMLWIGGVILHLPISACMAGYGNTCKFTVIDGFPDVNLSEMTSLLAWWSEFLTTNHEVPGSIPGSTMCVFPWKGKTPMVTMVWVDSRN